MPDDSRRNIKGRPRRLVAGIALLVALVGCGGPSDTLDPAAPTGAVEATAVDGRFQLTFIVDRGVVQADEVITGTATVRLLTPGGANLSGSSSMFGFEVMEAGGGTRHVEPVWPTDCAPHRLTANTPLVTPIVKSGASNGGTNAAFVDEFLRGSDVHLPRGAWDVTAVAMFLDGAACQGAPHTIRATVRVHVTE